MSYILDALRKSEQERLQGQPLASVRQQTAGAQSTQRPRWLLSLLAGNLALLTILAVWWLHSVTSANEQPIPAAADAQIVLTPAIAAPAGAEAAARQAPSAQMRSDVDDDSADAPAAEPTDIEESYTPSPDPALSNDDYERAGDWQSGNADLPPLVLSTHVYSSGPASRNVIINGVRLREGDKLDNGVVVEEINETGALVSFRGAKHQLDIGR